MKNERLKNIFASYPFETRVMVSMMEKILGSDKVDKMLDEMDSSGLPAEVMIEGRPLRFYSGLSEEQLDNIGLSADGKKELYEYYDKPANFKSKESSPSEPAKSEDTKEKAPESASNKAPEANK